MDTNVLGGITAAPGSTSESAETDSNQMQKIAFYFAIASAMTMQVHANAQPTETAKLQELNKQISAAYASNELEKAVAAYRKVIQIIEKTGNTPALKLALTNYAHLLERCGASKSAERGTILGRLQRIASDEESQKFVTKSADHLEVRARLKIKLGQIPAIKIDGPKGPEWRIFPDGLPEACQQPASLPNTSPQEPPEPASTLLDDPTLEANIVDVTPTGNKPASSSVNDASTVAGEAFIRLIEANRELQNKLESATYRNGYLEAELAGKQEQMKLLTDSARREGWWVRLGSWLTSSKSV